MGVCVGVSGSGGTGVVEMTTCLPESSALDPVVDLALNQANLNLALGVGKTGLMWHILRLESRSGTE